MSFAEFDEYDRQDKLREWDCQQEIPEEEHSLITNQSSDYDFQHAYDFEGGADEPAPPKLEEIDYSFLNGLRGVGSFSVYLCHFHN
jgi:hypothetical protein